MTQPRIMIKQNRYQSITRALLTVSMLAFSSTFAWSEEEPTDGRHIATPFTATLGTATAGVKSWHYQLQDINPGTIANLSADMVVIDHGTDGGPFTKADVERMQRKPDGSRRIV